MVQAAACPSPAEGRVRESWFFRVGHIIDHQSESLTLDLPEGDAHLHITCQNSPRVAKVSERTAVIIVVSRIDDFVGTAAQIEIPTRTVVALTGGNQKTVFILAGVLAEAYDFLVLAGSSVQDVLDLVFRQLVASAVVSFYHLGLSIRIQQLGRRIGQFGVIFHRAQALVRLCPGLVDVLQKALLGNCSAHIAAPAAAARQQGHSQHCCQQQRRQLFDLFHGFYVLLLDGAESTAPSIPIHYTPPPPVVLSI